MSRHQHTFVSWAVDLLVYVVVLGLFSEFTTEVRIDAFWLLLLTAVLLKALLWATVRIKNHAAGALRERDRVWLARGVTLVMLPLGKLVILEAVYLVFGGQVHLGGFFFIVLVIGALTLGEWAVRRVYSSLGEDELDGAVAA